MFLAAGTVSGQLYRTTYFMKGSPQRGAFNPAFRPYRGYVLIPALGNLNVNYTSNAFSLNSVVYPYEGRNVLIFNENIKWNDIEGLLKPSNDLDLEVSLPVIGFGFFTGRGFWTFDTKFKTEAGFSLPKDFFRFMKGVDSGDQHYSMGNISAGATATLTASLGYSHRIFENLTVGGRVNFLGGLVHAKAVYDKLDMNLTADVWDVAAAGSFTFAGRGINIYDEYDEATGRDIIDFDRTLEEGFDGYRFKGLSGFGMTFDIGAEYTLLDKFTFSLSVLDLGWMRWDKNSVTYAVSEANYQWAEETSGDFKDFVRFYRQDPASKVKSEVHATFVMGAEYDIFADEMLRVGAMYMNKRTEFVRRSELSLALSTTPVHWFTASLSYAARRYGNIGDSALNVFGLALNFHPGWINFIVGTDYMISKFNPQFIPVSQKTMNFYMGVSVPLAREKHIKLPKLGI